MLLIIITIVIFFLVLLGLYQKSTNAVCTSKKRLDGRTAIVTGGTSGMGLEIATDFAERGARVIIACPFKNEGTEAQKLIIDKSGNKDVVFKLLDLSSIISIRKFATDIIDNEKRLDLLINNAGVGAVREFTTDDGMSYIMQVNYFGPFLLTLLLLPLLNKTGTPSEAARVVNVSSILHIIGLINFEKINDINYWFSWQFYSNSKLCLMLFTHELSKKLKDNVLVNCVEPGTVGTGIFHCYGTIFGFIVGKLSFLLLKTPWQGAQTAIHAALDKRAGEVSGQMFRNCQLARAKGSAYNDETALKLWEKSVSLVGLSNGEVEQCLR